ncbi:YqaA family protein [Alcaligenes endophyticus]|uniref:DedA family protein n=1 Tax=Alcaligenes endophyticus TaxID=1929088 RepID=A0ABT8EG09_9BURK|nr:YqaA family protein [Alcaligenes endophyticus]MCX5590111.1 DedA family protein [Alcaligenes endophyticus]MDN4120226.1 DedA family protein [Alcaligenes endophyticus]
MEIWLEQSIQLFLHAFSLPQVGLSAIFIVCLVSATLLPMGSEPAVFAYVQLAPNMFWVAIIVATLGNTIGGAISYAMGVGAEKAYEKWRHSQPEHESDEQGEALKQKAAGRWHALSQRWLSRLGPPALLLSWLPVVGDPLCAVAGWLRLSFWPSVFYMAVGKFLRYLTLTALLVWIYPYLGFQ